MHLYVYDSIFCLSRNTTAIGTNERQAILDKGSCQVINIHHHIKDFWSAYYKTHTVTDLNNTWFVERLNIWHHAKGPILLTWINFNHGMDNTLHPL